MMKEGGGCRRRAVGAWGGCRRRAVEAQDAAAAGVPGAVRERGCRRHVVEAQDAVTLGVRPLSEVRSLWACGRSSMRGCLGRRPKPRTRLPRIWPKFGARSLWACGRDSGCGCLGCVAEAQDAAIEAMPSRAPRAPSVWRRPRRGRGYLCPQLDAHRFGAVRALAHGRPRAAEGRMSRQPRAAGWGDSSTPALRACARNDVTGEALPHVARMPRLPHAPVALGSQSRMPRAAEGRRVACPGWPGVAAAHGHARQIRERLARNVIPSGGRRPKLRNLPRSGPRTIGHGRSRSSKCAWTSTGSLLFCHRGTRGWQFFQLSDENSCRN